MRYYKITYNSRKNGLQSYSFSEKEATDIEDAKRLTCEKFKIKPKNIEGAEIIERMSYEEALQISLKMEWKVGFCSGGESCWCRMIETVQPIMYAEDEMFSLCHSGAISKEVAEHLVKVHNESLIAKEKALAKILEVIETPKANLLYGAERVEKLKEVYSKMKE